MMDVLRRRRCAPVGAMGSLVLVSLIAAAAMTSTTDAHACGACFLPTTGESTVVTGHRMALSVSTTRTVLWDQIRYQGSPEEFAWVLPVKGGATIELASDAFFEALDAATVTGVSSPQLNIMCGATPGTEDEYYDQPYSFGGCSMAGCSSEGSRTGFTPGIAGTDGKPAGPPIVPPVEVVHEDSIGPYEAVVLSSNKPGALYDWLASHGYGVDPSMEPVVDGYEADGFDFVALRLIPGVDVRQMRPVRVITPGASPVLPLKMVAAGTGANVALTLFVLGEGRWQAGNFPNSEVSASALSWDFATSSSNYGELKQSALSANAGWTWITTYSKPGALLSYVYDPVTGSSAYKASNGQSASTIADLYYLQGHVNGDRAAVYCSSPSNQGYSTDKVVDPCETDAGGGGAGGTGGVGGITSTGGMGGVGGSVNNGGVGGVTSTGGMGGVGGSVNTGGVGGVTSTGGTGGVGGSVNNGGAGGMGGAGGSASLCPHDRCTLGDPLSDLCDACTYSVCVNDPYCCATAWDKACVAEVAVICADTCESACPSIPAAGEIDARLFACGELDDVAVALVGMHPASVWVTRLEANLPRDALGQDLELAPAEQYSVENRLQTTAYSGDPCAAPGAASPPSTPRHTDKPRRRSSVDTADLLAVALTLATLLGAAARRALRRPGRLSV